MDRECEEYKKNRFTEKEKNRQKLKINLTVKRVLRK